MNIDLVQYLGTIILVCIQTISMAQATFNKALSTLYFNVSLDASAELVIQDLTLNKELTKTNSANKSFSLSSSMQMNTKDTFLNKSYSFAMNKSPIPGVKIDSGYIKIVVGETKHQKHILREEWCIQFDTARSAKESFNLLNEIFLPLSLKNSVKEEDEIIFSDFIAPNPEPSGVKQITFALGKSLISKKYEIRLFKFYDLDK